MGLNDAFLLDDSAETPPAAVSVNALKNTPPGQDPEMRDDVDLIGVNEQDAKELEGELQKSQAAVEELMVAFADLTYLDASLRQSKGMSRAIALECQNVIPDFISDVRPMGSFTTGVTQVNYKAALEEVADEKKGVFSRMAQWIIDVFKKIIYRISSFFGKKTKEQRISEVKEQEKATAEDVDWEKVYSTVSNVENGSFVQAAKKMQEAAAAAEPEKDIRTRAREDLAEVFRKASGDGVMRAKAIEDLAKKLEGAVSDEALKLLAFIGHKQHNSASLDFADVVSSGNKFSAIDSFINDREELQAAVDKYSQALASFEVSNKQEMLRALARSMTFYSHDFFHDTMVYVMMSLEVMRAPDFLKTSILELEKLQQSQAPDEKARERLDALKTCNSTMVGVSQIASVIDTTHNNYHALSRKYRKRQGSAANEQFEELYNSSHTTVQGGIVAAGAVPDAYAGSVQYHHAMAGADALSGVVGSSGVVSVSPRAALIAQTKTLLQSLGIVDEKITASLEEHKAGADQALHADEATCLALTKPELVDGAPAERLTELAPEGKPVSEVQVLQEALEAYSKGEEVSGDAIDLLTKDMRPREALSLSVKANNGTLDKNLFVNAVAEKKREFGAELTKSLTATMANIDATRSLVVAAQKNFSFGFGKKRDVTSQDAEKLKSLMNPETAGALVSVGNTISFPKVTKYISASNSLMGRDVFESSFSTALSDLNAQRRTMYAALDENFEDNYDQAISTILSAIFGHDTSFFKNHSGAFKDLLDVMSKLEFSLEKNLKRFLAIAEDKGYDNDAAYFRGLIKSYEILTQDFQYLGSCIHIYSKAAKKMA